MPTPKHKFYRSKHNGQVTPALSVPEGYEDKHPEDWEPATREEYVAQNRRRAPTLVGQFRELNEDLQPHPPVTSAPQAALPQTALPQPPLPPAPPAPPQVDGAGPPPESAQPDDTGLPPLPPHLIR